MSEFIIRECKHANCRAQIVFVSTSKGHQMPVDLATCNCTICGKAYPEHPSCLEPGGHRFRMAQVFTGSLMTSHFATCKNAAAFRRAKDGSFPAKNRPPD